MHVCRRAWEDSWNARLDMVNANSLSEKSEQIFIPYIIKLFLLRAHWTILIYHVPRCPWFLIQVRMQACARSAVMPLDFGELLDTGFFNRLDAAKF
jgi:hypothetical protein